MRLHRFPGPEDYPLPLKPRPITSIMLSGDASMMKEGKKMMLTFTAWSEVENFILKKWEDTSW